MNPYFDTAWVKTLLDLLATLFVFILGLVMLAIVVVYVLDVTQTKQALRRNYPVVVHFRYAFERLGQFFGKKCRSTVPSAPGYTAQRKT